MSEYDDLLKLTQQARPGFRDRLKQGLSGIADLGFQYAGFKTPEAFQQKNTFDENTLSGLIMKEKVKQLIEAQDPQKQMAMKLYEQALGGGAPGGANVPGGGYALESISPPGSGLTLKRQPTPEEQGREISFESQKQSAIASEKERQLNVSKISRLGSIADFTEKKWLETKPGKGFFGRVSGASSIPLSYLQSTNQQSIDFAYKSFAKGMRAQLAKAMGDVGNLSEPEQKAAMDLIPSLMDTTEVGLKKIQNIRAFVNLIQSGDIESARKLLSTSAPGNVPGNVSGGFVEGGIYKDPSSGERRKYQNGAWVSP